MASAQILMVHWQLVSGVTQVSPQVGHAERIFFRRLRGRNIPAVLEIFA